MIDKRQKDNANECSATKRLKHCGMAVLLWLSAVGTAVGQDEFSTTVFDGPEVPKIGSAPSHRIPALVQTSDSTLLAIGDYRYGLSDVGAGQQARIELWYRHSTDMGLTWTETRTVCPASTARDSWQWAMGDAAVVADRESREVLLMCAAGTVSNGASTALNPIRIGCFRSTDNGQTWDGGTELTSQIYGLFGGDATAIFITSGRLCQSRRIKVGTHYRVYAAFPVRTASRGNSTGVMYTDDFGRSWHLLGMDERFPDGTVYEEGKVEEMPDGNVALMVRDDRGTQGTDRAEKNFNYFRYTDVEHGEGVWSTAESGITGMANACNSAFALVPAKRSSDGASVYVLLTTVPFHTRYVRDVENNYGRKGVGFYYKEVSTPDDYTSGQALASGWQRGHQVTALCSAYADLLLLSDGYVGLLLEDNGRQGRGADGNNETEAYDLVYYHLSLSTITGGRYDIDPHGWELGMAHPAIEGAAWRAACPLIDIAGREHASSLTLRGRAIGIVQGRKVFVSAD